MSALQKFARMLGLGDDQAEDALRSESAARAVLSRRNLFAAGAALAAGSAFSFAAPDPFFLLAETLKQRQLKEWRTFSIYFMGKKIGEAKEAAWKVVEGSRLVAESNQSVELATPGDVSFSWVLP